MQNATHWELDPRFAGLLDHPDSIPSGLGRFVPDFDFACLPLANMALSTIAGTPSAIFVLRTMKAERLGRLLDEAVWDEELIRDVPTDVFHRILRDILGADVDKQAFEMKIASIRDATTRSAAMNLAQRYRQEGVLEGRQKGHQEGRQEGRQQGRQEALQDFVLKQLSTRFGLVPEGLRELIVSVTDEDTLRGLVTAAIECQSLEQFTDGL